MENEILPNTFTRDYQQKRNIMKHLLTIIITIILLAGCNFSSTPTPPPIEPSPPAAQTTPPPSSPVFEPPPTFVPSPELPVLAGMPPVPIPNEPITSENLDQIQQLAVWGKGQVRQVGYSPDGKILAVATTTGIHLYEADTLDLLRFIRTDHGVDSFRFSIDGQKLTAKLEAATTSWNILTGEQITLWDSFAPDTSSKEDVVLSPDQTLIVNDLEIWHVKDDRIQCTLSGYPVGRKKKVFSLDNRYFAITYSYGDGIDVWDVKNCQLSHTLVDIGKRAISMAFSPDGTRLVSTVRDKVQIWDIQTGMKVNELGGYWPIIRDMAVSPNGNLFFTPGFDIKGYPIGGEREIQKWDIGQGQFLQRYVVEDHTSGDINISLSADGKVLAVGGPIVRSIHTWNVETDQRISVIEMPLGFADSIAISPNGEKVIESGISIYDVQTGQLLNKWRHPVNNFGLSSYSLDGRLFAMGGEVGFGVVEVNTSELLLAVGDTVLGYGSSVPTFSPDGQHVALGNYYGQVQIWHIDTGEITLELNHPPARGRMTGLSYSPDGQLLASGIYLPQLPQGGNSIWLWTLSPDVQRYALPGYTTDISRLAFTSDGKLLISSALDGTIRFWGIPPK